MRTRVLRFLLAAVMTLLACEAQACRSAEVGKPAWSERNKAFKKLSKKKQQRCKTCVVFKEAKKAKKSGYKN